MPGGGKNADKEKRELSFHDAPSVSRSMMKGTHYYLANTQVVDQQFKGRGNPNAQIDCCFSQKRKHPLCGWSNRDWLSRFRMGMAEEAAHSYLCAELLPQRKRKEEPVLDSPTTNPGFRYWRVLFQ
jgi:hypothetical protein